MQLKIYRDKVDSTLYYLAENDIMQGYIIQTRGGMWEAFYRCEMIAYGMDLASVLSQAMSQILTTLFYEGRDKFTVEVLL